MVLDFWFLYFWYPQYWNDDVLELVDKLANDKSELSDTLGISELHLADEVTISPDNQLPPSEMKSIYILALKSDR